MNETDGKGFVVKDRRKVSLDEKEAEPKEAENKEEKKDEQARAKRGFDEAAPRSEGETRGPMPEVNFATFVFSLSSSALFHLGEIPEPETQETRVDLALAKQIIDTMGMLQEKTKGNLDPDEDRLLNQMLYDLRLRYVQKSGS
ncbi:MAG: DUF1844 domain-containing protein [Syntrophobacteraceae bacterium]